MKVLIACCFAAIAAITPANADIIYAFGGYASIVFPLPTFDTGQYNGVTVTLSEYPISFGPSCDFFSSVTPAGLSFTCALISQTDSGYVSYTLAGDTYPTSNGAYEIASSVYQIDGMVYNSGPNTLNITGAASIPEPPALLLACFGLCSCLLITRSWDETRCRFKVSALNTRPIIEQRRALAIAAQAANGLAAAHAAGLVHRDLKPTSSSTPEIQLYA